jgi:hypothetical protein
MKKNILSLVISGILVLGVTSCSDSSEEATFKTEATATQSVVGGASVSSTQTNAVDEFLTIDMDTTVAIPELQKLIDETILEYKVKVGEIRTQFTTVKAETTKEFKVNIDEIAKGYMEQKALFDKNCTKINTANEDSCNQLGTNVHGIKSQQEGLEVKLANQIKKITSDETNALRDLQSSMKNNIMSLKSQA